MKKILAGILASASLLAMTTSAFASTKEVKAAGDVEYDVAATTPKVVLNLIMPAKMSASLNPYGADIKMVEAIEADATATPPVAAVDEVTTNAGIASPAYEIVNMSVDYGIVIDASATTTVTSAKGDTWAVKTTAPADGVKSAQMALITAATAEDLKDVAEGTLTETAGSIMMLDSAKASKSKKFISIGAASEDKTDPDNVVVTGKSAFMGFAGKLAGSSETKDVEWTEDDSINVALVLKVVAGPKGASGSTPGGPTGPSYPAGTTGDVTTAQIKGTSITIAATTGVTDGTEYDVAFAGASNGSGVEIDMSAILDTGWTVGTVTSSTTSVATINTFGGLKIQPAGVGSTNVTIPVSDGTNTTNIILHVTIS